MEFGAYFAPNGVEGSAVVAFRRSALQEFQFEQGGATFNLTVYQEQKAKGGDRTPPFAAYNCDLKNQFS
jgi:hypothetical protein